MSRRSRAIPIRVRQEIWKRLELVMPAARDADASAVRAILDRPTRAGFDAGTPLQEILAGSTLPSWRFPPPPCGRPPAPDAAEVIASARAVERGETVVFGRRATAYEQGGNWLADPFDGRPWPTGRWSGIPLFQPGRDVKYVWELNRHHDLVRLAQGYHLTGDEALATRLGAFLDTWMTQNPPRRGINWTASLEVAFRAIAWCWVWSLTRHSSAWTEARTRRFLWQLWHHARYVEQYDSIHHSPNTHLTGEALGLLYVGMTFPLLRDAGRWRRLGTAILVEEIDHQFLADGFHYERATGYHRYHLEFYTHALLLLRAGGTDERALERIRSSLRDGMRAAAALARPDGSWPVFGDEDGGSTLRLASAPAADLRPLLAVGAAVFGDPTLLLQEGRASRALAWWLVDDAELQALDAMRPARPTAASAALPAAGYVVARDGWSADGWYCAVDVGPHGGKATGHAHTDLGHVEIAHGSTRLIADPGSLTYTCDPAHRAWHRSEEAHARPSVEGMPLARAAGPFGWERVSPNATWAVADDGSFWQCRLEYAHEEDGRRLAHERHVVLLRGLGVLVCDWLVLSPAVVRWSWPIPSDPAAIQMAPGRLEVAGLALSWRVSPVGVVPPKLTRSLFASSYSVPEAGAVLSVESAATGLAAAVMCATSSAVDSPSVELDGDHVRCSLAGSNGMVVAHFARGRPVRVAGLNGAVDPDSTAHATPDRTF